MLKIRRKRRRNRRRRRKKKKKKRAREGLEVWMARGSIFITREL
jgi:hypothetical protein